ncbi:MAG: hypothetical protein IT423_17240 [Pirellulaceae bacterium]|nr:hypothetical protein [Pirellulaceae bacterium]
MSNNTLGSDTRWFRTNQEKRLAIALVGIILAAVAYRSWGTVQGPWSTQLTRIARLDTSIEELIAEIDRREQTTLSSLSNQRQSLPGDTTLAATRYYAWLYELAAKHGFEDVKIDNTAPLKDPALGSRLTFSFQARANVESVGAFVDEFQSYPLLHGLTRLQMVDYSPLNREARVAATIELLCLSDAPDDMILPELTQATASSSDNLAALLSQTDPFRRYEPPRPVTVAPAIEVPVVDHLSKVKFIGVVNKDGARQAWFFDELSNTELLLSPSQLLNVEEFEGRLEQIEQYEVRVVRGEQVVTIRLGENIRTALSVSK